ncbi:uncharacterized protein LOC129579759 [Sitodiplosis mosellana]|uniref:uncharacterized protein LOC129578722 n=1 Tax=Sitodiplosis mosellana TaxID=263140 RepID=UPI002443A0D5|nr:uncharacterized protein LOC129578722 [Sitodiplosis mosellana]XP_055325901.1 uncharacterized protein LOC129579759 [Sitodiplosis mosellana]
MKLAIFVLCGTLLFALSMQQEAEDDCQFCIKEMDAMLRDIGPSASKQNVIDHVHERCATVMGGKIKDDCIGRFEGKMEEIISKMKKGISAIEVCVLVDYCPTAAASV